MSSSPENNCKIGYHRVQPSIFDYAFQEGVCSHCNLWMIRYRRDGEDDERLEGWTRWRESSPANAGTRDHHTYVIQEIDLP